MKKANNNLKKLVFAALLTALSIIIGWFCKAYFTFGPIRITFENLPILLAGILLGPIYGGLVGIASDIISALLSGFGINPIITAGAASVGIVGGVFCRYIIKRKGFFQILLSCGAAHIAGSMIIKSCGLLLYGYAWELILLRVPLYFAIGLAESYLVWLILKNKQLSRALERSGF